MALLRIIGWKEGLKKVSMTKLLQERLGLSLSHAKKITDDVLDGKTIFLNIEDEKTAESLAENLFKIDAIVKIERD
jgi:ribosomal protein L7/L12